MDFRGSSVTYSRHPTTSVLTELPASVEGLTGAWNERGIDYQRTFIGLTIESITVGPSRTRGRTFDPDRLQWKVRA